MLYPIQNDRRNCLDLSGIWDFQIDPDAVGEKQRWFDGIAKPRPIAVPGSWNEQYEDIFNYLGLAWYVKRTYVPSSWRGQRVFIRVGSACYFGTVYVNGVKIGSHEGGHLPFAFEITEHVRWDAENTIAISVENELQPTRVPSGNMQSPLGAFASFPRTTFDFFPFAGLHRPVVLYSTPQTYIADIAVETGFSKSAKSAQTVNGTVKVRVRLNDAVTTKIDVSVSAGSARHTASVAIRDGVGSASIKVPNARLWSDKNPYLYDLTISAGADRYALKIGIRTVAVRKGTILLNGEPVKLNGFGRHEDFIASGKGLNLPLMVKDYQLMRWTGANAYRTSHYPYSEEEMQLADREGFLIIDETPVVSLQFENDANARCTAAHVPATDRRACRARQKSPECADVVRRKRAVADQFATAAWRGGGAGSIRATRQARAGRAVSPRQTTRSHAPDDDRIRHGRSAQLDRKLRCNQHESLLGLVCDGG